MATDRIVAGLRCTEVLADLSEYLDGTLPAARREQIEGHVRSCDNCARFGRQFAKAVQALRDYLGTATAIDAGVGGRLRERIKQEALGPPNEPGA